LYRRHSDALIPGQLEIALRRHATLRAKTGGVDGTLPVAHRKIDFLVVQIGADLELDPLARER